MEMPLCRGFVATRPAPPWGGWGRVRGYTMECCSLFQLGWVAFLKFECTIVLWSMG
jgi:hypothetical protein